MESPLIDQKTDPARQTARQILRQRMARARTRLTPEQGAALSARLVTHLLAHFPAPPGRCIAFCWPIKNEPDIRAALEHWRAQGAVAALPVVTAAGQPLAFRAWTPATPLAPDRYGIPTPTAGDWLCPDALLIPLNAFDAQGYRLGYGGGFFDRTLAVWTPRPLTLGVGFELNRLASIEPEAHDLPLDWIFTEAGGERARR